MISLKCTLFYDAYSIYRKVCVITHIAGAV
jgi:hypothetical protein